ncbi:MAG: glycosyltransferase [Candidatus Zixiibacteriota bacterium]
MFGNGLSQSTYQRLCDSSTKPRPDIMAVPSPRIGYAGVISERLDVALRTALARQQPNWHFVLVGPVTNAAVGRRLQTHANIHLFEPVLQSEMPSVLRSFDVGLMPYLDNAFFHYLNPLKFYEMAAAGLHSVSSNVSELRQFSNELVTVLPNDPDLWCGAIDKAQSLDTGQVREAGKKVAREFIWEDMAAALLHDIADYYPHFTQDRISSNSR